MATLSKNEILGEIASLNKKEIIIGNQNSVRQDPLWKKKVEEKVPQSLEKTLTKAFCMAFSLIFKKGTSLIEKTYNKDNIKEDYQTHRFALDLNAQRELKKLKAKLLKSDLLTVAVSSAEGAALGAAGIGMPDIVVFTSLLLRSIYECALRFDFSYDTPEEQYIILKMIECAFAKDGEFDSLNAEIDALMKKDTLYVPTADELKAQLQKTATCLAMDMLVMKFIQGIPVVGIVGGLSNGIYSRRIMKYVTLKYQKRYLFKLLSETI